MKIFKYGIPICDEFDLSLPSSAQILSFQAQDEKLMIWCLIDDTKKYIPIKFLLRGTGQPIAQELFPIHFIGTAQLNGFVWHLFKRMMTSDLYHDSPFL